MVDITSKHSVKRALESSVYGIVFRKLDGTLRVMRCTLDKKHLPEIESSKPIVDYDNDLLTVWDLDIEGWRSFHVSSLISMNDQNEIEKPNHEVTNQIRDRAMRSWVEQINEKSDQLEVIYDKMIQQVRGLDNHAIMYLIYWNMGCSGPSPEHPLIPILKRELERRNDPYSDEIADAVSNAVEACL